MPDPTFLPMAPPEPPGPPPIFERVAVVGLGLIGASVALAARRRWPQAIVIGVDRDTVLEQAVTRHVVDVGSEELMIVSEADLVVLAAPVLENIRLLAALPEWVSGQAVVTDVGGTKRAIVEAARALPGRLVFVGGNPLAGAARAGIEFARPDLFDGRPWLVTPAGETDQPAIARLLSFCEGLGAQPRVLSPEAHDHLVALLSQLPQLTASALMSVVGEGVGEDGLALAGRGLVDTTRLATSPAGAWRDVCATNADEIGAALDALIAVLRRLRHELASAETIDAVFGAAAAWRARMPGKD